ncbi:MAG: magnesium transporter [Candidatus Latescibacterota bacterium]|jgi:magnesium transporter
MEQPGREDVEAVEKLVDSGDLAGLERHLRPLHPADIADLLEAMEPQKQAAVLKHLEKERAAEVLTEVDENSGQALLFLLSDGDVVTLLEEMPSDDAVDMMSAMPPERTARVEAMLSDENREQLHELMEFGEDTAGGIMELEGIAVREEATINEAIDLVRAAADEIENLQKIYVIRNDGVLTGHIDVLDLLIYPRSAPIRDAAKPNPVVVPLDMDQEEVANLFGKYDEFTLPVVDDEGKLVGRITVDDIIDVIEEEASEDIAHIAGTTEVEIGETSPIKISRSRLPWLIVGLTGQLFAALIMSRYEVPLKSWFVLAFFVPLIVGTAGSIGMQAAVVVVRELALGQINLRRMGQRVGRELIVAFMNGLTLGTILFVSVMVWQRDVDLSILLVGSLLIVIAVASFIGSSVPLLLERLRIDPAIATGPFIAVTNDIIGLAIYLSLATVYLSRLR